MAIRQDDFLKIPRYEMKGILTSPHNAGICSMATDVNFMSKSCWQFRYAV